MSGDFRGKRAIVTGGASGIGLAAARELARGGAEVWILDLEVPEAPGMRGVVADVTDHESLSRAFAEVGDVDVVVANAGVAKVAGLEATTLEDWERTIGVNLTGVFLTVQVAAAAMKPRRRGAIVVTASTNSYDGEPNLTAYNASKAGVLGIVHTVAGELGPYGIRVNAVCPGMIRTPLTAGSFSDAAVLKEYFRQIPLGRGGEAQEVGRAIAFLASDDASYITGATLLVDGGQMASKFGTWGEAGAEFVGDQWRMK